VIDYKKYHSEWKSRIRPAILARAANCCEQCKVANKKVILRGQWNGQEAYQCPDYGHIYNADTGEKIGQDYVGEVDPSGKRKFTRVVLTIAHLDHDIENNDPENLKALCQRCHLAHDLEHHRINARKTINRKKGLASLFPE